MSGLNPAPRAAVYLDNAATTRIDPRVAARMSELLGSDAEYGNAASSTHGFGTLAASLVEAARGQVAVALKADPAELIFTSGATEANNLALFGATEYYRGTGRHLITARTEHKAVLDACRELERRGCAVTYLSPDRRGVIDPSAIGAALRPDTVLASIMLVNNEIGVVQDMPAISALCAARGVLLHVDAAQAAGKISLDVAALGADLISLSAHKAYGPKGAGALWVRGVRATRPGVQLAPLHFGGGQERGMRAGTLATHQAVGMGLAFELLGDVAHETQRIATLQMRLWQGLEPLGGVLRNGDPRHAVPHILNVSFEDVEGESLLAALQGELAVSAGSACTSGTAEPSYVLRALGRNDRLAESSLRFGLGRFTTVSDIDRALQTVCGAVSRLRRIGGA